MTPKAHHSLLQKTTVLAVLIFTIQIGPLCFASTPPPPQATVSTLSGTVLETMNAGGYTYLLIDSGARKTWVAIPETSVKKGAKVQYSEGMVMENFHSKTLGRTFASIIFSPGLAGAPPAAAKMPASSATPADSFASAVKAESKTATAPQVELPPSGGSSGAVAPFTEVNIEKAQGDNSYTVAEVFAKAEELAGKTVRLRAKVVKVNLNIMGRNWLHLQDGTGNPLTNSHDLVATTAENPSLDQVVTIEGKIAANKDFGAGYSYAVLIEEVKIIP